MRIWDYIMKTKPLVLESKFEADQILQMSPGYHTRHPYYIEVLFFDAYAKKDQVKMITNIPCHHELNMVVGSNWEYHHRRMKIIGTKEKFEHLLHNQPLT